MPTSVALFVVVLFLSPLVIHSQISLTAAGPTGAYVQNFDGAFLGTVNYSHSNNAPANLGWYAVRSAGNATPNIFDEDTGSGTTGEFNNYGTLGAADRAYGSIASTGTGTLFYGLRIQNDTGNLIRSLRVQYTGEEWRDAANIPQTLSFTYQVSPGDITSLTTGTWTNATELDFITPTNTDADAAINGNLAANRIALDATILVDIPAGGEIMLRWSDANDTGDDHGVSIDDVSVTFFVPTAAAVSISGRASTALGLGIGNVIVSLSGGPLTQPEFTRTSPLGYYRFDNVPAGYTYLLQASSKRYSFVAPSLVISTHDDLVDCDFVTTSK